jgi:hypothetical protein
MEMKFTKAELRRASAAAYERDPDKAINNAFAGARERRASELRCAFRQLDEAINRAFERDVKTAPVKLPLL